MVLLSDIQKIAKEQQLEIVSALAIDEFREDLESQKDNLRAWQEKGYAGEMEYMNRSADLFVDARSFLPNAKTILSFVIPYAKSSEIVQMRNSEVPNGYGRIARYAWGRDYHRQIKKKITKFTKDLELISGESFDSRMFTDSVPLLERAFAKNSGLGFVGKNTLLIRPGVGSYFFIAELLVSFDLEKDIIIEPSKRENCGSCSFCLQKCPTNAFPEPGVLDARKCISYLTIEKKTIFTEWEGSAIGSWLFGCDECQIVCPYNHQNIEVSVIDEFNPESGNGQFLSLDKIFSIKTKEEFLKQFAGTSIMRAGREQLIRNALHVAHNTEYNIPRVYSNLLLNDLSIDVRETYKTLFC